MLRLVYSKLRRWRPAVMALALPVAFCTLLTCLFIFVFGFCAENKFFFFYSKVVQIKVMQSRLVTINVKSVFMCLCGLICNYVFTMSIISMLHVSSRARHRLMDASMMICSVLCQTEEQKVSYFKTRTRQHEEEEKEGCV